MAQDCNMQNELLLENTSILLVEDDDLLLTQLCDTFTNAGASFTTKQCLEEAITELKQNGAEYDLIVLDIMLPITRKDLEQLQELQQSLKGIREILKKEDTVRQNEKKELEEIEQAYFKRKAILAEMDRLIDRVAGLTFLDEYAENIKEIPMSPVFVLTAVGNRAVVSRGLERLDDHGDWIVKPIAVNNLLDKATELISKGKKVLDKEAD